MTQHRFFSNLWVWVRLSTWRNEWNSTSKCWSHALFTWTTTVIVAVLHVSFWFGHIWGCRFNLLYNIGRWVRKCYIVLHRLTGWSKNTIFALYRPNNVNGPLPQRYYSNLLPPATWNALYAKPAMVHMVLWFTLHIGILYLSNFYRAMLCIRGTSHDRVSIRLSVLHKSVFY